MRPTDIFDAYLEGRLSVAERLDFEKKLSEDQVYATAFKAHQTLLETLQASDEREALRKKIKAIHAKEIGNGRVISLLKEENFAQKHGRTIAVAASTAIIAVLSSVAVLSTGGYFFKQQSNQITDLNRVVMELQASSNGIIDGITKNNKKANYAPANFEGSAFALNNNGYIVTSFHMVNGADSIFVQNGSTERSLTKIVFCDPKLDLAIIKLENDAISKNWQVPFSMKNKDSDIGEKVFTLGYPRRDVVYGEGSLSSLSGYSNDTNMYQISIPVNPGNSGGPLLDESGNVIGLIRGKIAGAEGTSFAIKAREILKSIDQTASDSARPLLSAQSSRKSSLRSLKRSDQLKKINPYVFNVLVYKGE